MTTEGPTFRSRDGYCDLSEWTDRYGLLGKFMVDATTWARYCKNPEQIFGLISSMVEAMDFMLASSQADEASFDFKHWYSRGKNRKADWTRLRASMYADEENTPWVLITESPKQAHRWRGRSRA